MQVKVPQGCGPGTALQIQTPAGQLLAVTVPQGVGPGMMFQVQVPAAQQRVVVQQQLQQAVVHGQQLGHKVKGVRGLLAVVLVLVWVRWWCAWCWDSVLTHLHSLAASS